MLLANTEKINMEIEKEISDIRMRNKRVETDKAWETSWTRRLVIALFTYIVAGIWLIVIENEKPWLTAFIPTGGYLISTFSLPLIKKWWMKKA